MVLRIDGWEKLESIRYKKKYSVICSGVRLGGFSLGKFPIAIGQSVCAERIPLFDNIKSVKSFAILCLPIGYII